MRKIIDFIRSHTPLSLRIKFGPAFAYVDYLLKIRILKNGYRPHILSMDETLDTIIDKHLSVIRYGDGELSNILHTNLGFQKYHPELSKRLREVLRAQDEGLLICIPGFFGSIEHFSKNAYWFSLHHLFKHRRDWKPLLVPDHIYGDAFISRPYLIFNDDQNSERWIKKLKQIWTGKRVLLIEGEKSRIGIGNDLLSSATSVKRILCPAEQAFDVYEKILNKALELPKQDIVLVSLGPTAKILVYDLFKNGHQAIDIGHIDMEYEMYLRKSHNIVPVKYKYFNEIEERNPEDCNDPTYLEQIVARIDN